MYGHIKIISTPKSQKLKFHDPFVTKFHTFDVEDEICTFAIVQQLSSLQRFPGTNIAFRKMASITPGASLPPFLNDFVHFAI